MRVAKLALDLGMANLAENRPRLSRCRFVDIAIEGVTPMIPKTTAIRIVAGAFHNLSICNDISQTDIVSYV
jgi:hypothetical protein